MELRDNAKNNVWFETVRTMAQKEIEYKEGIYKKIAGIRRRQIISITLASTVIVLLGGILYITLKNLNDISVLIRTLSAGFEGLKT